MTTIAPCLWFDRQAEEAARFYVSLVPDSRLVTILPSPIDWPGGTVADVLMVEFTLAGKPYQALNGGPFHRFNPAISLSLGCDSQEELDRLWEALCEGGEPGQCGWLKDRYGVSWQLCPSDFGAMMKAATPSAAKRVMEAVIDMTKLDIARMRKAATG